MSKMQKIFTGILLYLPFLILTACGGGKGDDKLITLSLLYLLTRPAPQPTVSTFAGCWPNYGSNDGTGTAACLTSPGGMAMDASGNIYFVGGNKVRMITPAGVVTTIAGSGACSSVNGNGISASFCLPTAVAIDASGNLYVSEETNSLIRKIDTSRNVTTYAGNAANACTGPTGGIGIAADFCFPSGLAVDNVGDVFVADTSYRRIRRIAASNQDVTIFAGSGTCGSATGNGIFASFCSPAGMTRDAIDNLYVADGTSKKIRKIDSSQNVTTLAGSGVSGTLDGTSTSAQFSSPNAVALDSAGNIFVTDSHRIRKINSLGNVTTYAGTGVSSYLDGPANLAKFNGTGGIAVDSSGNVFVSDTGNHVIRKISP